MKKNTKKILLSLYQPEEVGNLLINRQSFFWLLSNLSTNGVNSLLSYLDKKQLIVLQDWRYESGQKRKVVRMSQYGKSLLEAEIPTLKILNNKDIKFWSELVFLQAPKSDRNFRYLRKFLLTEKFVPLSRGVFLYPGDIPDKIMQLITNLYFSCVVVLKVDQWLFGDEKLIMGSKCGLSDSFEIASGIGKEISELLIKKQNNKKLSNQQKKAIASIFDRLLEVLELGSGLHEHIFSQEGKILDYLFQVQTIIKI